MDLHKKDALHNNVTRGVPRATILRGSTAGDCNNTIICYTDEDNDRESSEVGTGTVQVPLGIH